MPPQSATVPPDDAARTLESVRVTREATRERLPPYWFGYVVFGVLTIISSWFAGVWDGGGLTLFWLLATPLGCFVVSRHQRAEQRDEGATPTGRPYALGVAILIVPACVLGAIGAATGEADIVQFGLSVVFAGALFVLAWIYRDVGMAVVGTALVALVAYTAIADVHGVWILNGLGTGWVVVGLTSRKSQRDEAQSANTTGTQGA